MADLSGLISALISAGAKTSGAIGAAGKAIGGAVKNVSDVATFPQRALSGEKEAVGQILSGLVQSGLDQAGFKQPRATGAAPTTPMQTEAEQQIPGQMTLKEGDQEITLKNKGGIGKIWEQFFPGLQKQQGEMNWLQQSMQRLALMAPQAPQVMGGLAGIQEMQGGQPIQSRDALNALVNAANAYKTDIGEAWMATQSPQFAQGLETSQGIREQAAQGIGQLLENIVGKPGKAIGVEGADGQKAAVLATKIRDVNSAIQMLQGQNPNTASSILYAAIQRGNLNQNQAADVWDKIYGVK